jgi:hypothetical protein
MREGEAARRAEHKGERSLGELFADLLGEIRTLVRQEMELARAEMSQKAAVAGRSVAYIAAGAVVAYAGLLAIVAAIVLGVSRIIPLGWSAFLVGVVVALIGGFLAMKGINNFRRLEVVPQQTIETLKEDKEWAKRRMR